MYVTNSWGPADAEVIDVLIAIINISARLGRMLTTLAAQSKSEEETEAEAGGCLRSTDR